MMLFETALDLIFRALRALYELLKWGPTSANSSPTRFVFVRTRAGKERLRPALSAGNLVEPMAAAATAIVGCELRFRGQPPQPFPLTDARGRSIGNDERIRSTTLRIGTLQGAYLIITACALGLDCGPMSGFNAAKVDAEPFSEVTVRTNFLCNVG